MPHTDKISNCVGLLCLAIGKGTLRDEVALMIDQLQKYVYDRGFEAGKK